MRINSLSTKAERSYPERWMAYRITRACTKCGACISECPTEAILEGKTQYYIDADTCMDHKACVVVCPVNAIEAIPDEKE